MQHLQPLVPSNLRSQHVQIAPSHVQQQSCQIPSSQVLFPRTNGTNGSFQGRRDTLEVTNENCGSPFRLSKQDFPSVGSSDSEPCNRFWPLVLGKSPSQDLLVQQKENTASSSQVHFPRGNGSFKVLKDTPEVVHEKPRSPFLDLFKPSVGRSPSQHLRFTASSVQQKWHQASSSRFPLTHTNDRFQGQKESLGVAHNNSETGFQLNEPEFPTLVSRYLRSGSCCHISGVTRTGARTK